MTDLLPGSESAVEPSYWADVLENILAVVCQALADTPQGMPNSCYTGHAKPPDDCCDHLVVYVERFRPTIDFPVEFNSYDRCQIVRQMMDVCILLRRPCWPVVHDNATNPFPPPADIDAASVNLMLDAQKMWQSVTRAYDAGLLIVTPREPSFIKWGQITPGPNMGGCAGWEMRMTIDLDECT